MGSVRFEKSALKLRQEIVTDFTGTMKAVFGICLSIARGSKKRCKTQFFCQWEFYVAAWLGL